MRIALFGYGKMGKMLERLGIERGHSIVAKIDLNTPKSTIDYSNIDVAIDFSTPDAAFDNIKQCMENNVPVISGTTGWLDRYEEIVSLCNKLSGAFIYASNFSLGVNLFFELNRKLAQMMNGLEAYKVNLEEIHHIHKLDAPSGTAITLAEGIIEKSDYNAWKLNESEKNEVPIISKREGEVPGTHSIKYRSDVDTIEIKHEAHNRQGFALGAIVAAEWIQGRKGVFTMKDVLNLA